MGLLGVTALDQLDPDYLCPVLPLGPAHPLSPFFPPSSPSAAPASPDPLISLHSS
jgi:hypothetical protein